MSTAISGRWILILLIGLSPMATGAGEKGGIEWQPWSDQIFERAKRENRFVLLDLEAVWCHWCHVMDDKTYRDADVAKLIASHYIPVKVDQDANPDLSNRYEDYGWPATVVFAPDGSEIVKRRGYLPPLVMASLLDAIIKDPSPGPSVLPAVAVRAAADGHKFYPLADAERRRLGMPRIDKHVYSRENGWAIRGLTALYDVTGDPKVLARANDAAAWIVANRGLGGGGFGHGENDRAGPFLGDTLAMGEAFLALHSSTGERGWLKKAEEAAQFIVANFRHDVAFETTRTPRADTGVFQKPVRNIDENLNVARFANLLSHYTGNSAYRDIAEHALKYLGSPVIAGRNRFLAGLLLVDRDFVEDPAHITVVGAKDDEQARALHAMALHYPALYRRVE